MAYLQPQTLQLITIQPESFPIIKYFIRLSLGLQPEWEAVLYKFHFLVYTRSTPEVSRGLRYA